MGGFANNPYVRVPFTAGCYLVSAFSHELPEGWQPLGLYAGLFLGSFSAVAFCWHALNARRESRGKPRLKLEPIYLVGLGLLIAAGGAVWQINVSWNRPSVETISTIAPVLRAAPQPSALAFPIRSPSDADKEIPVVDSVLDLLRDFKSIGGEGGRLSSNWYNALVRPDTMPTYDDDLRSYGLAITAADAKIVLLKNQAPQYFEDDIDLITNKADFENLYRTFSNFASAWVALKSIVNVQKATPDETQRLMAPHKAALETAINVFGDWITNSRESLLNRRKELSRIAATK